MLQDQNIIFWLMLIKTQKKAVEIYVKYTLV